MKMTSVKMSVLFVLSIVSTTIFAQNTGYSSNQLILRFEEGTSPSEQQDILDQYNLVIVDGPTPVTNFLLCEIYPNFPNLPPGSYMNAIDSINGVIVVVNDEEADIDGVGLSHFTKAPYDFHGYANETGGGVLAQCPNHPFNINVDNVGQGFVHTGIFDTGIAGDGNGLNFIIDFPSLFNPYFDLTNPGINFVNSDPYPTDDNGHGTMMSSMIVMEAGFNSNTTKLQAYKTHNMNGNGSLFGIIKAIDYSIITGIDIVNMSFSYTASSEERDNLSVPLRIAIDEAEEMNGTLFIAAAGNNGFDNDSNGADNIAFPASFTSPNIISVASVGCEGKLSPFSNTGKSSVDLASPGEDITGAFLDGEYGIISGTSPAAAHVTKVASQLASNQQTFDYVAIKCAILSSTTYNPTLNGKVFTRGYLNAEGALSQLLNGCQSNGGNGVYDHAKIAPIEDGDPWHVNYLVDDGGVRLDIFSNMNRKMIIDLISISGKKLISRNFDLVTGVNSFFFSLEDFKQTNLMILNLKSSGRQKNIKILR